MSCCSCKHLKDDKKYKGCVSGCKYFCGKVKNYVYGDNDVCQFFEKSYTRKNIDCDKIYEDGKNFCDDKHSPSYYILILVLLVVVGIVLAIINNFK